MMTATVERLRPLVIRLCVTRVAHIHTNTLPGVIFPRSSVASIFPLFIHLLYSPAGRAATTTTTTIVIIRPPTPADNPRPKLETRDNNRAE